MSADNNIAEHMEAAREGARKRTIADLMAKLDAESITHQDRGQIAVRQWARAWLNEQRG